MTNRHLINHFSVPVYGTMESGLLSTASLCLQQVLDSSYYPRDQWNENLSAGRSGPSRTAMSELSDSKRKKKVYA
jgi:hypothetical protein